MQPGGGLREQALRRERSTQRDERHHLVLPPTDRPGEIERTPRPRQRLVEASELELQLRTDDRQPSGDQPVLPRGARERVVPGRWPVPLDRADVVRQQLGADEVGARVHPRHVEVAGSELLDHPLAASASLVERVDISKRARGVVRHADVPRPEAVGGRDRLFAASDRLLVASEPRQVEPDLAEAPDHVLRALGPETADLRSLARELESPLVAPHPVVDGDLQVVVGRQLVGPGARRPPGEGPIADLGCAGQVPGIPAHRVRRAQHGERAPLDFRCLGRRQLDGSPCPNERLLRVLPVTHRTRARDERLDLLGTVEFGQQSRELRHCPIDLPQIREGDAALETDRAPLVVGAGEFEGLRVEIPRLLARHRVASPLGCEEVVPHRPVGLARLTTVVREDPCDVVRVGGAPFDLGRDGGVQARDAWPAGASRRRRRARARA